MWKTCLAILRCLTLPVVIVGVSAIATADVERDLRAARQSLRTDVRHSHPEERAATIRKLEIYPTVEAARVLVLQGLASSEPELRRAAYATLLQIQSAPEVRDFLHETIVKDLKKRDVGPRTSGALRVIIASSESGLEHDLSELLAPSPQGNLAARQLLVLLADELGETQDDADAVKQIGVIAHMPLFEKDFAVRRASVQSLTHHRSPAAIESAIGLLERATGEVRADILRYLAKVSGKSWTERKDWMEWWQANQGKIDLPAAPPVAAAPAAPADPPGTSGSTSLFQQAKAFYDIPLLANRIVFVIDTSRSMQGIRIVRAKEQLIKAVSELAPEVEFNVVAFSGSVKTWQKKLVFASAKNKQDARRFVELLPLGSHTASYDALEVGLKFDTEAIYFLTDGMPNSGRIRAPADIVNAISGENRFRRVSFHAIGVGVGPVGGLFDTFLRTLAAQNYGEYRRVDE